MTISKEFCKCIKLQCVCVYTHSTNLSECMKISQRALCTQTASSPYGKIGQKWNFHSKPKHYSNPAKQPFFCPLSLVGLWFRFGTKGSIVLLTTSAKLWLLPGQTWAIYSDFVQYPYYGREKQFGATISAPKDCTKIAPLGYSWVIP